MQQQSNRPCPFNRGSPPRPSFSQKFRYLRKLAFLIASLMRGSNFSFCPDLPLTGPARRHRNQIYKRVHNYRKPAGPGPSVPAAFAFACLLASIMQQQSNRPCPFNRGSPPRPSFSQKFRYLRKLAFLIASLMRGSNFSFCPDLPLTGPARRHRSQIYKRVHNYRKPAGPGPSVPAAFAFACLLL